MLPKSFEMTERVSRSTIETRVYGTGRHGNQPLAEYRKVNKSFHLKELQALPQSYTNESFGSLIGNINGSCRFAPLYAH